MKRNGKSIVSCLLVLALLLGLVPAMTPTGQAAGYHSHDNVYFQTEWTSTTALPATAGRYYLSANVNITSTWTPTSGVTWLCLNGKSINKNGSGSVINVSSDCTLYIYDEAANAGMIKGGKDTKQGGGVCVNGGKFYLYGGQITGNNATGASSTGDNTALVAGGGVYVANSGTFEMYGGKITGNTVSCTGNNENYSVGGGGVYVNSSASGFKMYGGVIENNTVTFSTTSTQATECGGGGVYGKIEIYGGTIQNNTLKVV